MRILADENIPYAAQACAAFGTVETFRGRDLRAADVRGAEVLLVRSVTRVDRELLAGSAVRFVGSATIGFDHVDLPWLGARGIHFARAPGSNAVSAAEYVVAALLLLAAARGRDLAEMTVGVVGRGNVGSRVIRRLTALGVRCLAHDPPLAARGGTGLVERAAVLEADVVSLHVPLERAGDHPTRHMVDADFLAAMRDDAILVNTARGDVVVAAALAARLASSPAFDVVLDVWPGEPQIDATLAGRVAIGSPHIAGYSLDGKVRGTEMIYRALCGHLGVEPTWSAAEVLPPAPLQRLVPGADVATDEAVRKAVLACYDPRDDDLLLRQSLRAADPGTAFDRLRKAYRVRREFASLEVVVPAGREALAGRLRGLGFGVSGGCP